jgi:hypothetical protein
MISRRHFQLDSEVENNAALRSALECGKAGDTATRLFGGAGGGGNYDSGPKIAPKIELHLKK